ncbi:MAG: AAC(3) family N-acetyltransferase [Clostridia bacterium]|nr:AAC(3) family N-acetyltransferase [Clostridia bacterium]
MYTKSDIIAQLAEMKAPRRSVVHIHSSLRAVGDVEGRGEGLLDALIEYFVSEGGTLTFPTHTWINLIENKHPTLDVLNSKSCVGTLSNLALAHPDSRRTLHPTHSMAVFGNDFITDEFIECDNDVHTSTDPKGCYGRIYDSFGYILLVGVGHDRNTFLHCAEEMLGLPNRISAEPADVTVKHADGRIEERKLRYHINNVHHRYPRYEAAFRYHGCIVDGFVGDAPAMLCDAVRMKQVLEMIYARADGVDVLLETEGEIDEKLYKGWFQTK